jgi:hypothetical protein
MGLGFSFWGDRVGTHGLRPPATIHQTTRKRSGHEKAVSIEATTSPSAARPNQLQEKWNSPPANIRTPRQLKGGFLLILVITSFLSENFGPAERARIKRTGEAATQRTTSVFLGAERPKVGYVIHRNPPISLPHCLP